MRKLKELTERQESELLERREFGESRKNLIVDFGISEREYKKIILKHGGTLKSKVRKYNFNEDYFENIDTEDKAYFLGFITADGNITRNVLNISQKDSEILYEFKIFTEFEGNIFKHGQRNIHCINLVSKKIVSDLESLGILPTKTKSVEFANIPDNLVRHYMRGVFDGDGCISIHKKRESSRDTSDRGQVNLCSASKNFIEQYVDRLNAYCGINKNKIRNPKGTYYVIDWGSFSDIEKFHDFFYKDAIVYLKRKKETFDRALDISKTKTRYRKT